MAPESEDNQWGMSSQSRVLSENHTNRVSVIHPDMIVRDESGFGSPKISPPTSHRVYQRPNDTKEHSQND